MYRIIITLALIIIFFGLPAQSADKVVYVGGYELPPFVIKEELIP